MKRITISIIVPVYNVANVVIETLLSIKNQKKSADEVIIIDDGSTDNSYNVIKNFEHLQGWKIFKTPKFAKLLTKITQTIMTR